MRILKAFDEAGIDMPTRTMTLVQAPPPEPRS
jgi:hypothetical protein